MDDLLPCPFCPDGKVKDYIGDREAGVVCSCGASILVSHGTYVSEDEALCEGIKLWNTRHYPPEVEKAVEKETVKVPLKSDFCEVCPSCRIGIPGMMVITTYCPNCGQRIKE